MRPSKPGEALRTIRERYTDLVRYRDVNWADPEVVKLVERIEYETGRLLQEQDTNPNSPRYGFFGAPQKAQVGGQALVTARNKAEKAIHMLTSAYWCKPSRFHRSKRLLRTIERAYRALDRKPPIRDAKSVHDIAPPYRHRRADLCRWLAQVGDDLAKDVRVHMKDTLRTLLVRQQTKDGTRGLYKLLGAACLEDTRLLLAAGNDMAKIHANRRPSSGVNGRVCIEDAAEYCSAVCRYQYFTSDTDLALPAESTRQARELLRKFISWTMYRGRADVLAYRRPKRWSGKVERDVATAMAYLTATELDAPTFWRFAYGPVLRRAFGHKDQAYHRLDLSPLTAAVESVPPYGRQPRGKYFDEGRYLSIHRPSFFTGLRFPMRKGYTLDYSRLDVRMNLRSAPNDPNLLFLLPEFEPLLAGNTFSKYIARKKNRYLLNECSETTCADAAVLDEQAAIAGVRLRIKRKDNFLTANKSWVFFEDKIVFAGSGIETKSYDLKNRGWAASSTDHRASITFAFPKPVQIDFARIHFRVNRGRLYCVPRVIYFMVSGDGVTWTRVREAKPEDLPKSGDYPLGGMTYRLRRSKVLYHRLFFPYDADGFTTQIAEVEFYNIGAQSDTDAIPSNAPNLARMARVFTTSTLDKKLGPELITDGDCAPVLDPAETQTCLSILRTRSTRFTYHGPRGVRRIAFPAFGKETKLHGVHWCHIKQTAYFFLRPADLILKGVGHGYGRISIDHANSASFAVVCFPNLDLEQTPRAAEAGLVKLVCLDKSAHVFVDEASGTTAAAFFDIVKGDKMTSEGPAYMLYRQHSDLLITAKSRRGAPSNVWLKAPETKTLVVNGKVQPVYKNGELVRVSAHR